MCLALSHAIKSREKVPNITAAEWEDSYEVLLLRVQLLLSQFFRVCDVYVYAGHRHTFLLSIFPIGGCNFAGNWLSTQMLLEMLHANKSDG